MGRGDGRSRKGKIFKGSFGNTRPKGKKVLKARAKNKVTAKKAAGTTTTAKKTTSKKAKE
jgi:ribosomal small subunit protein bTHX